MYRQGYGNTGPAGGPGPSNPYGNPYGNAGFQNQPYQQPSNAYANDDSGKKGSGNDPLLTVIRWFKARSDKECGRGGVCAIGAGRVLLYHRGPRHAVCDERGHPFHWDCAVGVQASEAEEFGRVESRESRADPDIFGDADVLQFCHGVRRAHVAGSHVVGGHRGGCVRYARSAEGDVPEGV